MLVTLILITFSTLAVWDTLRRLLPVHAPGVVSRAICFVIALALLVWGTPHILLATAAVGVLMLLSNWVTVEPTYPWGPYALAFARWLKARRRGETTPGTLATPPKSKVGNRIPKL